MSRAHTRTLTPPVHALLAAGVNADRHHEILGLDVTSPEDPSLTGFPKNIWRQI